MYSNNLFLDTQDCSEVPLIDWSLPIVFDDSAKYSQEVYLFFCGMTEFEERLKAEYFKRKKIKKGVNCAYFYSCGSGYALGAGQRKILTKLDCKSKLYIVGHGSDASNLIQALDCDIPRCGGRQINVAQLAGFLSEYLCREEVHPEFEYDQWHYLRISLIVCNAASHANNPFVSTAGNLQLNLLKHSVFAEVSGRVHVVKMNNSDARLYSEVMHPSLGSALRILEKTICPILQKCWRQSVESRLTYNNISIWQKFIRNLQEFIHIALDPFKSFFLKDSPCYRLDYMDRNKSWFAELYDIYDGHFKKLLKLNPSVAEDEKMVPGIFLDLLLMIIPIIACHGKRHPEGGKLLFTFKERFSGFGMKIPPRLSCHRKVKYCWMKGQEKSYIFNDVWVRYYKKTTPLNDFRGKYIKYSNNRMQKLQ